MATPGHRFTYLSADEVKSRIMSTAHRPNAVHYLRILSVVFSLLEVDHDVMQRNGGLDFWRAKSELALHLVFLSQKLYIYICMGFLVTLEVREGYHTPHIHIYTPPHCVSAARAGPAPVCALGLSETFRITT